MTLAEIRQAKTKQDIVKALKFYIENLSKLTNGEEHAFNRTIEIQAFKLGISNNELNQLVNELRAPHV